ncbi:spore coat protein GerQ [Paenibacillus sp. GCM10027628]|uniref:spore coat protein GerQ n=1 Tax=Paenibacillus sp. GCM10027628 TaxID=3273413 RepID=UPI00362D79DF
MMNNPYKTGMQVPYGYPYPTTYPAPTQPTSAPTGVTTAPPGVSTFIPGPGQGQLPMEESFIENILRLNLGKMATLYMTYENNSEWNAKIFKGRLEAAGRDHIIISDPATGMRYLLLMVNLDYITFDEELNYYYPYAGGKGPQGR